MKKNEYGLFTAIGMIVGVVIGSGIFFKSDNILIATNGSVSLGVLVFCIAAIGIIFGSLTISELASRNTKAGGVITYAEYSYNKSIACAFGWFHTFLYYPALISVVSWVSGIYICMLFGFDGGLEVQILIGLAIMIIIFILNVLSAKLGGLFQNASTVIKIIPLVFIAIAGLTFGNPTSISISDITHMQSFGWITAIAPIAFSFDGWIVATSIGHEIKDSSKNLPKALVVAPLFILIIYLLYFVGISIYVGPETVMSLGDAHVDLAANSIFGSWGAKIILTFVVISILGTVNGLTMGLTRLPYSLSLRGMFPKYKVFSKVNEKLGMPVQSSIIAFIISVLWLGIHYLTQKFELLPNSDISEISITINYVLYILLYVKVFRMGRSGEIKGLWKGLLNPLLATIGSLIILVGSMGNPLFWLNASISLMVLIGAIVFWNYQSKKINIE
ncbi:APC family permease [Clostridium chauvoei]|uniref:Putative Amino acid permease-associated region n=1 Tax=Clostridium chauvoei JF4335 TaxID=1351755 RepID=S6ERE2_9CLOT|nr:APC family permease [Clostridium chauvoei]ATD55112.1 amino acid permease [Clostridium chauvoei]ATD57215.1 amino acid permease [Clostridium chauvoei]MBX7279457.1 APC family permease [Clostridium chauvoei]MBX7282457.1 APC family permease [Clostridium chauvoei]MBX7285656.1 APC family permease [Clostridium chauvoei]